MRVLILIMENPAERSTDVLTAHQREQARKEAEQAMMGGGAIFHLPDDMAAHVHQKERAENKRRVAANEKLPLCDQLPVFVKKQAA